MYQEWETPSFGFEQLIELCKEFLKSRQLSPSVQRKGSGEAIVRADADPSLGTISLIVEKVGPRLKLTFPPPSLSRSDLNRFLGIFVTGLGVKVDAERQLSLDRLEQDFWEYLDRRLAELQAERPPDLDD